MGKGELRSMEMGAGDVTFDHMYHNYPGDITKGQSNIHNIHYK